MKDRYHPALDFVLAMEKTWPSLLPALSAKCKKRKISPRADGYPLSMQAWADIISVSIKKDVLPALSPVQRAAWPPRQAVQVDHALGLAAPIALAWNATRQVYRFDDTTREHLLEMTDTGDLPLSLFNRLPHPVFFVEEASTIDMADGSSLPVSGFFVRVAKVEDRTQENNAEPYRRIQILPVIDQSSAPPLSPLTTWVVGAGAVSLELDSQRALNHYASAGTTVQAMIDYSLAQVDRSVSSASNRHKADFDFASLFSNSANPLIQAVHQWATARIPMLVYMASEKPDIVVGQRDNPGVPIGNSAPKKTQYNDVGFREGAVFRQRFADLEAISSVRSANTSGVSPRPHWRRAHWHRYWTGPKHKPDERVLVPRWQPAVPVLGTVVELSTQGPVRHKVL